MEAEIKRWWATPRFELVERLYTARDVATLR
jgi:isocitrate lyase